MIAIKKGKTMELYEVSIDLEKLSILRDIIREKCSYVVEKRLCMESDYSNNPDIVIVSSTKKNDIFNNVCHIVFKPKVVEYIEQLLENNDHKLVFDIFNSFNLEASTTVTKKQIINQCKRFIITKSEDDLNRLYKMISINRKEKVLLEPTDKVKDYKEEIIECFKFTKVDSVEINSCNNRLTQNNSSYKLIPETYLGFGKNKTLKLALKKSQNNLTKAR